jgi:DNA repair protein RecO (recombination protein O)
MKFLIAMALRNATGIVIQSLDFGESDKIVTFFTLEEGKLKGIAKGARRSRKRFSNCLDLFCHVRIQFFEKEDRSLTRIDQCDGVDFFPALSEDIVKMSYGSYFVELVDALVGERQVNRGAFELLRSFLSTLANQAPREEMLRVFEIRLLSLVGYRPHLDGCVNCLKSVEEMEGVYFDPARGGILCKRCTNPKERVFSVSKGTVKLLVKSSDTELDKIQRLRFTPSALRESRDMLPDFIQYHVGRPLKSLRFLESMKVGVSS